MNNLMEVARLTGILQRLLREHGEEATADIVARALTAASKYHYEVTQKKKRRHMVNLDHSSSTASQQHQTTTG